MPQRAQSGNVTRSAVGKSEGRVILQPKHRGPAPEPLPVNTSFFIGKTCNIPTISPWQDAIRAQFGKTLHFYNSRGTSFPTGGEK